MAETTGTSSGGSRLITGLFRDGESAERAIDLLRSRGYSIDNISVLMSDETRSSLTPSSGGRETGFGNYAPGGAVAGATSGGAFGATLEAIASKGTYVALSGLLLVIAGPLALALAGAGAGSFTHGLVGALIGSGIPQERARQYEQGIREGGIVLGVNVHSDEDTDYFKREIQAFDPHGAGWGEDR